MKLENPFYHNYLFSEKDIERAVIKWWQYPLELLFCKTYVQIGDGYAFFYKQRGNQYFFIKVEKLEMLSGNYDIESPNPQRGLIKGRKTMSENDKLLDEAIKAIESLFSDMTVDKAKCKHNLNELLSIIEIKLDSL